MEKVKELFDQKSQLSGGGEGKEGNLLIYADKFTATEAECRWSCYFHWQPRTKGIPDMKCTLESEERERERNKKCFLLSSIN